MTTSLGIFNYKNYSVYYRPKTVDEAVLAHSFDNDIFYAGIPEYKGASDALVIDVGGHIGTFSMYSLLSIKAGKVIALEPNKESFEILTKNILENGFKDQITALQLALSDKNGLVKLYLDEENWGHSLTNSSLRDFEEVPAITLASLMELQKIEKCDLIKFNCEGAEFQILLSLDAIALSKIKMMIILFHEDMVSGVSRKTLIDFLRNHGFLTRIDNEGSYRGWIIAKNSVYYGSPQHHIIQAKKWLKAGLTKSMKNVRRALVNTNLWNYAKRIVRKV